MARNWKLIQPTSLIHALRLSKNYAHEVHNLSVERIADKMGVGHDLLYKWLANGRMPAISIPAFETVCRCTFVSTWLALSAGKLVIEIPTGRSTAATDIHQLQTVLNDAVGQILKFASGQSEATDALAAIQSGMVGLAWHKINIEKHQQPELELGDQ